MSIMKRKKSADTPQGVADMTKGGEKVNINEVIEKRWEEHAKHQEEMRRRMRTAWKTDPSVLDEYFRAVVTNWKQYKGPKTEKIVCKIYGIYKQAVVGDCNVPNTHDILTLGSKKWEQWNSRKGISKEESKRRFISYCAEIDPMLIDVMPNEMPPEGFPCDNKGIPICAKCNTTAGCSRPLLDEHFENLRRQLFERAELQDPINLRSWMANAIKNQRCMWGVHKSINKVDALAFSEWFNRTENKGFSPYDSKNLILMVRDLLSLMYDILYDMQLNKDRHSIEDINQQVFRVYAMDRYYFDFSGDKFVYEVECTRDNEVCNKRRAGDGGRNHKHPVEIEPPEVDYSPFDEAISLRKKCQALGINPATGVQVDVEKRCEIYREKLREYERAQEAKKAARERNELRSITLPQSKLKIKNISSELLKKHMITACNDMNKAKVLSLAERGCDCNVETPRGLRPLTVVQIQSPTNAEFDAIFKCRNCNVNAINKYGMSGLMLACRMKEMKTILYYIENAGADESVTEGTRGLGRTALHYCAIHGSEEAAKIIHANVHKTEDIMRMTKFMDCQDSNGDTALIVAARVGNGAMCRTLLLLGANPLLKNNNKRTAAIEARENRFLHLADWLSKKVSIGIGGVETVSDVQFDKTVRYGSMQVLSMITEFCRATLLLLLGRSSGSIFGTPSQTRKYIIENGEYGKKEQNRLVNSYMKFVLNRQKIEIPEEISRHIQTMRSNLESIMEILRQGEVYPSIEMGEKPMPWTPLMCACVLNDWRSIKRLKQWGADLNYQNRHGTTALMLSAQLNNTDAIVELLMSGASTSPLDNEGFSALAYASSLPVPHELQKSAVDVICEDSPRSFFSADEVIKLALNHTPEEVSKRVLNRKVEEETNDKQHLSLLERQGLTHVKTVEDLKKSLKRAHFEGDGSSIRKELESIRNSQAGSTLSKILRVDKAESNHDGTVQTVTLRSSGMNVSDLISSTDDSSGQSNQQEEKSTAVKRCPICTLKIPCHHFYKEESLDDYMSKKTAGKRNYADGSALGYEKEKKKREARILRNQLMNNVFNKESMQVLRETELDDRNTNRSDRYLAYLGAGAKGPDKVLPLNPFANSAEDDQQRTNDHLESQAIEKHSIHKNVNNESQTVVLSSGESHGRSEPSKGSEETSGRHGEDDSEAMFVGAQYPNKKDDDDKNAQKQIESKIECLETKNNVSSQQSSQQQTASPVDFVKDQYEKDKQESSDHKTREESYSTNDTQNDNNAVDDNDGKGPEPRLLEKALVDVTDLVRSKSADEAHHSHQNENIRDCYNFSSTLPNPSDTPAKTILKAPSQSPTKKFKERKRVIRFRIEDEVLSGGIGSDHADVSDVEVCSFQEAISTHGSEDTSSVTEANIISAPDVSKTRTDDNVSNSHKGEKKIESSVDALTDARKNNKASTNEKLFGANPVSIESRGVAMFTRRNRNAVSLDEDHLEGIVSSTTTKKPQDQPTATKNQKFLASLVQEPRLHFSGWIFSGLFSLDVAKKPIDTFCIEVERWRNCMNDLDNSFRNDWASNYFRLECMVDMESWKITSKPCSTCMVGFVRCREDASVKDEDCLLKDVCMTCFYRKKLFEGVVKAVPRSARKMFLHEWPFHVKDDGVEQFSDDDRKHMIMKFLRGYSAVAITSQMKKTDAFDPSKIMEGKLNVDMLVMADGEDEDEEPDIDEVQKTEIAKYYKTTKSRDEAKMFMEMVKTGKVAPVVVDESNKLTIEKKKRVYTGARKVLNPKQANVKSNSLTEKYSKSQQAKIQPSELPLMHVLLSNRNFEEVERTCRICLSLEEYGGEEGVLYIATLMILQAEMYKSLGLWVLSLALYLDATDLLVSRLGFDDRASINSYCHVDLIFRRLDMSDFGKLYMSSLLARIKKHKMSDNLRKNESIDAILLKYSQFLRHDQRFAALISDMTRAFNPNRELWQLGFQVYGLDSLVKVLMSSSPNALSARASFLDYCDSIASYSYDANNTNYKAYASFCVECIALWNCTSDELYRLLVQRLIKQYLSKQANEKHICVAEAHESVAPENIQKSITSFLRTGASIPPETFNPTLEFCLAALLKPFRSFVGSSIGEVVRRKLLGEDANAEFFHVICVQIQNAWRVHKARRKVALLRK